jgi:hypothetical protein
MGRQEDMSPGWPGAARVARVVAIIAAVALSACGGLGGGPDPRQGDGGLELSFEDEPEPSVFQLEAEAVRDTPDGAAGLWAAVSGLDRPERAEAVNVGTRKRVSLALYRARGSGPAIRLSNEAADALGVKDQPVNVRITALRRRPVVDTR